MQYTLKQVKNKMHYSNKSEFSFLNSERIQATGSTRFKQQLHIHKKKEKPMQCDKNVFVDDFNECVIHSIIQHQTAMLRVKKLLPVVKERIHF